MKPYDREPHWIEVAYALFGGPVTWGAHLWAATALVPAGCMHELTWVINVVTALTALAGAGTILSGWRISRVHLSPAGERTGRTLLLGRLAMAFGAASLLLILVEGAPVLAIGPCRR